MREQDSKDEIDSFMKVATDVMFKKMSAKSGTKKLGEKAVAAMVKECIQIDKGSMEGKPVITSIDPGSLSYDANSKVLEAVNLIKKKINGII